jgi:hypothetical protein
MTGKHKLFAFALILSGPALAQIPDILIEACSLLDTSSKRVECLRVASQGNASSPTAGHIQNAPAPSYLAAPVTSSRTNSAATERRSSSSSGRTCYVGPRGGTYTITKSGRKNYGGC